MVTFSGLVSGLDTTSLITSLVAAEKATVTPLATQRDNLGSQKSIVSSITSQLGKLADAFKAMDLASEVRPRTATSSDAHVGVAVAGGATPITHRVRVGQLAEAQLVTSRTFATAGAGVLGTGQVTITPSSGTPATITWDSTDTLQSIADRISASGSGVAAAVLFDGSQYRLTVAATATGTAAAATFVDGGDGLDLGQPTNVMIAARDAQLTVDGVPITRGSNVVADALAGVTLTLKSPHAATDADASVAVSLDREAATKQLTTLVDAYNGVSALISNQLRYDGSTKNGATLFGDSTLRRLQSALALAVTSEHGGITMSSVGLSLDRAGKMSLDQGKLTAALDANPDAIGKLFVDGGLATAMTAVTDEYLRGGDGLLAAKTKALTDRQAVYQKQIDRAEASAEALRVRLESQFATMEKTMAAWQNQATFITRAFG